jgi:hypothetical protein
MLLLWALMVLTALTLPNLLVWWQDGINHRAMFHQIDRDLVGELRKRIRPLETVAFLPWGNDFFANYLAPRAGFRTFNIGGDKNLDEAQQKWPTAMLSLGGKIDGEDAPAVLKLLSDGTVDVAVVPYFHMLWSAHSWPCLDVTERKAQVLPVIRALQKSPYVDVIDADFFAAIRLRPAFSGSANRSALRSDLVAKLHYPIVLSSDVEESAFILTEGWHVLEAHHVWSYANAKLTLPIPQDCVARHCAAVLQFVVFGADPQRPVSVSFHSADPGGRWSEKIIATSGDGNEVAVPLGGVSGSREISISIPDATSPHALNISADERILGIALQRAELVFK